MTLAAPTRTRMTGAQRREQLLDVGRSLFAERGFDGTSVEEVAHRALVSKPVVYEHFGGKDGLYAAVVDREVAGLLEAFSSALSGQGARELLEQACLALLTYVEDSAEGFAILVRESPQPHGTGGLATLMSDVAEKVEHVLERELGRTGHPTSMAALYSQALVGQVSLVGQWWAEHRELPREEVAAHLVNLAWHGLSRLDTAPTLVTQPR